jgi:hypothetical protein
MMAAILCQCPVCREAAELARLDRDDMEMTRIAIAWVADRYQLDDTDALLHLRLHAINGTGVIQ